MAKRAKVKRPKGGELLSVAAIARRDKWRCGLCGGRVSQHLKHPDLMASSMDHIIPLSQGGTNDLANLQLTHLRCNLSKRQTARNEQLRILG